MNQELSVSMRSKSVRNIGIVIITILLLGGTFSGGFIVGWVVPHNRVQAAAGLPSVDNILPAQTDQPTDQQNLDELFKPFWEAWNIVHDQYVDQPVDDTKMMQGAISGMMDSLGDPHSSYMDPTQYQQQLSPLEGEYEGIGAWIDTTGDYVIIIAAIPGSPAEAAGLQSGDKVIAVDGEDMTGIDGELVQKRILGPAGTDVTLTIVRESEPQPFDVTITRAKVTIPSVEGKMLEQNIAYVQISTFAQNTDTELEDTLKTLLAQNPDGLILDLRYNGGGYLDTAIDVVSEFLPANQVAMYEEFGDGTRRTLTTSNKGTAKDIPLVVLVNEGTASASEITAGAIQDYGRGVLVGVKTYGKGSVQNWVPLQNDQGAIRVTIARWLTPKERQINLVGLEPDYSVELTDEDLQNGIDAQLDKAIQLLTEQVPVQP
jgi:carboxyl-terminal processing protease